MLQSCWLHLFTPPPPNLFSLQLEPRKEINGKESIQGRLLTFCGRVSEVSVAAGRWHYDRYVTLHNTKRPKLHNYKIGHSYIKRRQDRFPSPLWLEFQMSAAAKVHVGPLNRTANSNTPIWQHLKPLHTGCFYYFF